MLAYAAERRAVAKPHPKTLLLIVAGHAALLFAVMTARGDIVPIDKDGPIVVDFIDPVKPPPPPPPPPQPQKPHETTISRIDQIKQVIDTPIVNPIPFDPGSTTTTPTNGTTEIVLPPIIEPVRPPVVTSSVKVAPRSLTPSTELVPPYPDDKRRVGEEAVLKVALSIDPRGRVTSVDPLGSADPSFLEAARRHILKRWKYKPATEDGVAVASHLNVTIRFKMEG